jgi:hypothetical protein
VRHLRSLLLSASIACALAAPLAPARADADKERLTLPVYGISFIPPGGEWLSNPCPFCPNIATYYLLDAQHHLISELDIQATETPPFERHNLDELALTLNAEVLIQTFSIDNAPTVAVRKERGDDRSPAFLTLVADHGGRSYSFSIHTIGNNLSTHELITLVKSVKWIAPEDPILHLSPTQKVPIFSDINLDASIQIPTLFRRIPPNREKGFDVFLATDAAGKQVAAITFHFIPATADNPGIPQDDKLLEERRHLLETAEKRWGMPDFPLMDNKNPLDHGVITSATATSSFSADARAINAVSRYGAIFNNAGVTEVEMRIIDQPPEAAAKWDKTLLEIANSFRLAAGSTTQPVTP